MIAWTPPPKSRVVSHWADEPEFYLWAEMREPLRTAKGISFGVLIGLAFWVVVGVSVWIGRRMGL